ncbi:hypothetical protein F5141DRAFT_1059240 [Pisolithus sp. B1]|nr:hypothetical protein F5141DRAFT_1059240 [Pisolithus sp. B1]
MSTQEEQLIELMLTLKNTTPDQARSILASTPQIAYALITLMVKMNAVDVQVLQTRVKTKKTVTAYSTNVPPQPAIQPVSAVPPHFSQQYNRTPTPQTHTPTHYNGQGHPSQPQPQPQPIAFTGQAQYGGGAGPATGYGVPPQQQSLDFAGRACVLARRAEGIVVPYPASVELSPTTLLSMLPPSERAGVIQLGDRFDWINQLPHHAPLTFSYLPSAINALTTPGRHTYSSNALELLRTTANYVPAQA